MPPVAPSAAADTDPARPEIDPDATLADLVAATVAINRTLRVADARLQPTTEAVVDTVSAFTGFDAGLVLVEAGRLEPQATSARVPLELDLLQQRLGDGPCLEAAREQVVVQLDDTAHETRWPVFAAEAGTLGVASMLCVPLWIDDHLVGTLSLYSGQPRAFGERDHHVALLCATLAAAAIADAQRSEQLRGALARRDVIGQAKGVLMAAGRVTADEAFDLLRKASQGRNEKLFVVAEYVVETGMLPDVVVRERTSV